MVKITVLRKAAAVGFSGVSATAGGRHGRGLSDRKVHADDILTIERLGRWADDTNLEQQDRAT
jgi:hypothetical protein